MSWLTWSTIDRGEQRCSGVKSILDIEVIILKSLMDPPMIINMFSRVFKSNACLSKRMVVFGKFAFLFFLLKGVAWIAGAVLITWHYTQ